MLQQGYGEAAIQGTFIDKYRLLSLVRGPIHIGF